MWHLENLNKKALSLTSDTVAAASNDPQQVGAPSTRTWVFKTLKKGTHALMLKSYPNWKKAEEAENTFQITVKVL